MVGVLSGKHSDVVRIAVLLAAYVKDKKPIYTRVSQCTHGSRCLFDPVAGVAERYTEAVDLLSEAKVNSISSGLETLHSVSYIRMAEEWLREAKAVVLMLPGHTIDAAVTTHLDDLRKYLVDGVEVSFEGARGLAAADAISPGKPHHTSALMSKKFAVLSRCLGAGVVVDRFVTCDSSLARRVLTANMRDGTYWTLDMAEELFGSDSV